MPYSELVKNFNKIREYMRDFYVYGFKGREDFDAKSTRTYDDERRRIESCLSDYMHFQNTPDGKSVAITIDSRSGKHNPFYKAWKAKSFTDGDITLHFLLMDILAPTCVSESEDNGVMRGLPLSGILEKVDAYLSASAGARTFDESTIRKKLKEYQEEGIVLSEKEGKTVYYRRTPGFEEIDAQVLHYFSEVAPLGVIGAFCADKQEKEASLFTFKHHYITAAMDSEIMCALFEAMREKCVVTLETFLPKEKRSSSGIFVPLQVRISVQSGRQYLMTYGYDARRIMSVRLDHIVSVKNGAPCPEFEAHRKKLATMEPNIWGVSTQSWSGSRMEHVEFTVRYENNEEFIHQRLVREKRVGTVERIDRNTSRFSADVFDSTELVPWIRTFIGRLVDVQFSNAKLQERFKKDIEKMYSLYGLTDSSESGLRDITGSETPGEGATQNEKGGETP